MIVMVVLGDGFDGSESTTLSNDDDDDGHRPPHLHEKKTGLGPT